MSNVLSLAFLSGHLSVCYRGSDRSRLSECLFDLQQLVMNSFWIEQQLDFHLSGSSQSAGRNADTQQQQQQHQQQQLLTA